MIRPLRSSSQRGPMADTIMHHRSLQLADPAVHVVIVMDGLREFTTEALEWALQNIMAAGSTVTLLGAMPWLNIPLFSKTWQDVWAVEFEELTIAKEELKSDAKYLKLQAVVDLCKKYGVLPRKEVVMGFPLKLLVLEKIVNLHATWVVFDRYERKNREFYSERIPCNMVMRNENGEVDMIKGQQTMDNGEYTPGESPASSVPTPQLIIGDAWR